MKCTTCRHVVFVASRDFALEPLCHIIIVWLSARPIFKLFVDIRQQPREAGVTPKCVLKYATEVLPPGRVPRRPPAARVDGLLGLDVVLEELHLLRDLVEEFHHHVCCVCWSGRLGLSLEVVHLLNDATQMAAQVIPVHGGGVDVVRGLLGAVAAAEERPALGRRPLEGRRGLGVLIHVVGETHVLAPRPSTLPLTLEVEILQHIEHGVAASL
mmetsp:Transcript_59128/g.168129  ORF Transcript_59128/g.168129 Transcript_59128/m.168129 type:complete len:213 (+) Transcript_59128:1254-1892(+)